MSGRPLDSYIFNHVNRFFMAIVKPFKGVRPPVDFVEKVVCRPYDVLNSSEAKLEAEGNPMSLYRIIKPEIEFDEWVDEHDIRVYNKANENYCRFKEKGWLVAENEEKYYVYAQTMNHKTQYGLVLCAHIDDYFNEVIKKHELTRRDKEEDRMKHVRVTNANVEPVFFAYPHHDELDEIVANVVRSKPLYDFVAEGDGFGHHFWVIDDAQTIQRITILFAQIPALYIADGHHRSAAAALVGDEKRRQNPNHTGNEEYNYFMAVCFPDNQLNIIDYNRLVKDLNDLSDDEFLDKLKQHFEVEKKGLEIYKPNKLHNFALYLSNNWYSLTAKEGSFNDSDPLVVLDVTISSNLILDQILGIEDLRSDNRIDFVGGIRGLDELKRRVDSKEMRAGLALYPVSMKQLIAIADSGNIMPPKTTWFEPKLRSGLVIHELE